MKWFLLVLPALILPFMVWAQTQPDLVAQAESKKLHGDFQGALTDYSQAIAADPQNAKAYVGRATILSLEGNNAAALADDTKAIAIDPKFAVAFTNRGNVRVAMGDLDGAVRDYTEAIALDPRHLHAFINRGNVKNLQKKYNAAIADYTTAIALDPKNAVAFYNRAGAKAALGNYAEASADYSQAIALNPNDAPAYIDRAIMEMAQQNWPAATSDLNKCLTLLPAARQAYPRIFLWVIATRDPTGVNHATLELAKAADFVQKPLSETWGWQIAKFLVGKVDETAFIASAPSFQTKTRTLDQKKAQAFYYAGLKREIAGDKAGASKLFHQCLTTGNPAQHEFVLARAALQSLGANHP
jgi:tetratricopeptide (TPR) repeat protein